MKKVYYLSTCSTCANIMSSLPLDGFEKQNIKSEPITDEQLDQMKEMVGSYEQLFNRRSMKYRALNLKEKNLSEQDYRDYILKEYTFLKRPVFVIDNKIFVGNSRNVIVQLQKELNSSP